MEPQILPKKEEDVDGDDKADHEEHKKQHHDGLANRASLSGAPSQVAPSLAHQQRASEQLHSPAAAAEAEPADPVSGAAGGLDDLLGDDEDRKSAAATRQP